MPMVASARSRFALAAGFFLPSALWHLDGAQGRKGVWNRRQSERVRRGVKEGGKKGKLLSSLLLFLPDPPLPLRGWEKGGRKGGGEKGKYWKSLRNSSLDPPSSPPPSGGWVVERGKEGRKEGKIIKNPFENPSWPPLFPSGGKKRREGEGGKGGERRGILP